jgi:hypothetical protein
MNSTNDILEYDIWVSKRNVVHLGNMTLKVVLCKKSLHLERLFWNEVMVK